MADADEQAFLQRQAVPELVDAALADVLDIRPEGPPGGVCAVSCRMHHWFGRSCVTRRWEAGGPRGQNHTGGGADSDDEERSSRGTQSEGEVVPEPQPDAPRDHPLSIAVRTPHLKFLRRTIDLFRLNGRGVLLSTDNAQSVESARRFRDAGVDVSEDSRRRWRECLLCGEGLGDYLGAVILHPEALRQVSDALMPFPEVIDVAGCVVGVSADTGMFDPGGGTAGEQCPAALDGWAERAAVYFQQGARAATLRAEYLVTNAMISDFLMSYNAQTLAAFAAESQRKGLVPVLCTIVRRDGAHDLSTAGVALHRILGALAAALHEHGAHWDQLVIAVSACMPGEQSTQQRPKPADIAHATLHALHHCLPPACAAVAITDDGFQGQEQLATECVNAMHASKLPWPLQYCFGDGVQWTALKLWAGKAVNAAEAHAAFQLRCRMNFLAAQGRYVPADDDRETKALLSATAAY
eukprot:TRINITY_DN18046_c0_g1_i1.p2 TRINITY_DN18046_c0_g1~~TRINITY_DN18046_c0_g1_i1.p2  ORF type:complete len:467 (+),score=122.41 TRINITY_DN18046_c0_g1_i1:78-1478(+)